MRTTTALLLSIAACDGQTVAPCAEEPLLRITAASDTATGTSPGELGLTDITVNGVPLDSVALLAWWPWNVRPVAGGLSCTLPCSFGGEPGTYVFDVQAEGFYGMSAQAVVEEGADPACQAAINRRTEVALFLTEADSARVSFSFAPARATALPASGVATVVYDDGSGPRTVALQHPWPSFVTANSGLLHITYVVAAPDTIAVAELSLQLTKDWSWNVSGHLTDRDPALDSCLETRAFPLRRAVAGADSLYIGLGGQALSEDVIIC